MILVCFLCYWFCFDFVYLFVFGIEWNLEFGYFGFDYDLGCVWDLFGYVWCFGGYGCVGVLCCGIGGEVVLFFVCGGIGCVSGLVLW